MRIVPFRPFELHRNHIIASVLMQSARKVQSEETRTRLFDAHQSASYRSPPCSSILAASTVGDVTLLHLTAFCECIDASMIRHHNKPSLEVMAMTAPPALTPP